MIRPAIVLIALPMWIATSLAAEEQAGAKANPPQNATFTGTHRNQGLHGRPETATVTDGKSYIRLTEQEYRFGGYRPPYQTLPMVIVQRLPVQTHIPIGQTPPEH